MTVDGNTNRILGFTYDNNGNTTAMTNLTAVYDVDNRITRSTHGSNGTDYYAYAPDNKRVWKKKPDGSEEFYFYGAGGQKLGTYKIVYEMQYGYRFEVVSTELSFAGRKIWNQNTTVALDRLGSVRYVYGTGAKRYYPYGEEQVTSTNDADKFGTYYRDATTGLDYADQRYHASTLGRFLTPDPYEASAGAEHPGSWNRYGYVTTDPINLVDPTGLKSDKPDSLSFWDKVKGFFSNFNKPEAAGPPELGLFTAPGDLIELLRQYDYYTALERAEDGLDVAWDKANQALAKEKCRGLFETGDGKDPSTVLAGLVTGKQYGKISFTRGMGKNTAETSVSPWDLRISLSGASFQQVRVQINMTDWNMRGMLEENTLTLLHELGHAMNYLSTGNNKIIKDESAEQSTKNDDLIRENCLKDLKWN